MEPGSSFIFRLEVRPTVTSMPLASVALNPCFSTLTLYMPGFSRVNRKLPSPSLVVVSLPVAPVNVTLAPGTTAPVGSMTTPPRLPFTADSCAIPATTKNKKRAQTKTLNTLLPICFACSFRDFVGKPTCSSLLRTTFSSLLQPTFGGQKDTGQTCSLWVI